MEYKPWDFLEKTNQNEICLKNNAWWWFWFMFYIDIDETNLKCKCCELKVMKNESSLAFIYEENFIKKDN